MTEQAQELDIKTGDDSEKNKEGVVTQDVPQEASSAQESPLAETEVDNSAAAAVKMNLLERRCLGLLRMALGPRVEIVCQEGTLPGRPDFYIAKFRLVVFVDGIFWHPGKGQRMRRVALHFLAKDDEDKSHFWFKKAETNERRDRQVNRELRELGLKVVRLKEERLREDARDPLGYVSKALGLALSASVAAAVAARETKKPDSGVG